MLTQELFHLDAVKSDLGLLCATLGLEARLGSHRCPLHQEQHGNSLSVFQRDGRCYWRCHGKCAIGGTVIDALIKVEGISQEEALKRFGVESSGGPVFHRKFRRISQNEEPATPTPVSCRMDSTINAIDAQLEHIPEIMRRALKDRGIPSWVVERYRFAFFDRITFSERRKDFTHSFCWLIPICGKTGQTLAVKLHRELPQDGEQKSGWLPVGEKGHGFCTLWPPPESWDSDSLRASISDWPDEWKERFEQAIEADRDYYSMLSDSQLEEMVETRVRAENKNAEPKISDRWIILTPGELKALACIGAGFAATSITYGESAKWTRGLASRLAERKVAILYDDDDAGIRFRDRAIVALRCRCADLKAITFGRSDDGKIDANDVASENGTAGLRTMIAEKLSASPSLTRKPFDLADHRRELAEVVERAITDKDGGVWLLKGVVGSGKSEAIIRAILKHVDKKFAIFAPSHALARKPYEDQLPNALRLLSPHQMTREGKGPDPAGICPKDAEILARSALGIPYGNICEQCPFVMNCPITTQKGRIEEAKVLLLQYAHLRMTDYKPEYVEDRIRIIDESAIANGLRWIDEFTFEDLDSFASALEDFAKTENGSKHRDAIITVRGMISSLRHLGDRRSTDMSRHRVYDKGLSKHWQQYLSGVNPVKNLLPLLLNSSSNGGWIRCSEKDSKRSFWTVLSAMPDDKQPLIILDATADVETYRQIFAGRTIHVWPDTDVPAPKSEIIQFADGGYPAQSLIEEGQPSKTFEAICSHVRKAAQAQKVPWEQVGVITIKSLIELGALKAEFPEVPVKQTMNFGGLRGRRELTDCRMVAVIGTPEVSDVELAKISLRINRADADPRDMAAASGRCKENVMLSGEDGAEYQVENVAYADHRLKTARSMTVVSELVQAIGRARPYELRPWKQTILVFSNQSLPCPVSRVLDRETHLEEMGLAPKQKDIDGRVWEAMAALPLPFGKAALASRLGDLVESTLNHRKYREAIRKAMTSLGLTFVRKPSSEGGSATGEFVKAEVSAPSYIIYKEPALTSGSEAAGEAIKDDAPASKTGVPAKIRATPPVWFVDLVKVWLDEHQRIMDFEKDRRCKLAPAEITERVYGRLKSASAKCERQSAQAAA